MEIVRLFSGCYHCGEQGHSRTPNAKLGLKGCEKYEALKKSHGGVPKDYEGALERFIKEKQLAQGVTSLQQASLEEEAPSE